MVKFPKTNKIMKYLYIIVFLILSQSLFSQLDYKTFEGEKGKISFNKKYSYTRIYDYKINASKEDSIISRSLSSTIPEGLLTKEYEENLFNNKPDSVVFEVIMLSKLRVDINTKRLCLIKYKTRSNNQTSESKLFQAIKEEGVWNVSTSTDNEIQLLKQIFLNTDVNMLFEFYNSGDNKDYADINTLKPQVKESNGVINIKKLANIISENKAVLQKYLKE